MPEPPWLSVDCPATKLAIANNYRNYSSVHIQYIAIKIAIQCVRMAIPNVAIYGTTIRIAKLWNDYGPTTRELR